MMPVITPKLGRKTGVWAGAPTPRRRHITAGNVDICKLATCSRLLLGVWVDRSSVDTRIVWGVRGPILRRVNPFTGDARTPLRSALHRRRGIPSAFATEPASDFTRCPPTFSIILESVLRVLGPRPRGRTSPTRDRPVVPGPCYRREIVFQYTIFASPAKLWWGVYMLRDAVTALAGERDRGKKPSPHRVRKPVWSGKRVVGTQKYGTMTTNQTEWPTMVVGRKVILGNVGLHRELYRGRCTRGADPRLFA